MENKIQLIDNALKPEDFIDLRISAGFLKTPFPQAQKALQNGLFSVAVYSGERAVGMGRLVGDGMMYWYIQDVVVLPDYQGQGIGKAIVQRLVQYAKENSLPGTKASIGLMAAKNKESFYEKLGFTRRPDENRGAGMTKWL